MKTLRGCWWTFGTVGTILFMIGLALVYPWLLIVTGIVFVVVGLIGGLGAVLGGHHQS